ncbi:MAG: hypothetical protein P8J86_12135 [Phycisphaerales bacterium]|nr:hypothetical protein [Phycisphaerales bacterium]
MTLVIAMTMSSGALAQAGPEEAARVYLDDFVHYGLTANVQLAAANGNALMNLPLSDADLAKLVDDGPVPLDRFERAIARTQNVPELSDLSSRLALRIEKGRRDLARDPDRVAQAIAMLSGTRRDQLLGRQRLMAAGEYAMPALVEQIRQSNNEQQKLMVLEVMREIGRPGVYPLAVALPHLAPADQRRVVDVLGDIGYFHATPVLLAMSLDDRMTPPVRDSAVLAYRDAGGLPMDLSSLYALTARRHLEGDSVLVAYPNEATNNVWGWESFGGLRPTPVPTPIFKQVRAMDLSSRSLAVDDTNENALALFVAANLIRQNQMPAGGVDPIFGQLQYSPAFYARVFGPATGQRVLALGIDLDDTQLVRDALSGLSKTSGGGNLFQGGQRQPLLELADYPDRRVQYESALLLARANPEQNFPGDFRVVPTLASSIRISGKNYAMLVAPEEEDRRALASQLEALGFDVLASASRADELEIPISQAPAVDLFVMRAATAGVAERSISSVRNYGKIASAPVLCLVPLSEIPTLTNKYVDDRRIEVAPGGLSEGEMAMAIDVLLERASGGRISELEAEAYAIESLQVMRELAASERSIYNVGDADSTLIEVLNNTTDFMQLMVADVLLLRNTPQAQQAVIDAALRANGDQQMDLLDRAAESVKLHGNQARQQQVVALVMLNQSATGDTADAVATLIGALDLSSRDLIMVVPTPK